MAWRSWLNKLKDIIAPAAGFMVGGPAGAALGGALAGATGRGKPKLGSIAKGAAVGALTGGTTAGAIQGAGRGFAEREGLGRLAGLFGGGAKGALAGYQRPAASAAMGGAGSAGLGMADEISTAADIASGLGDIGGAVAAAEPAARGAGLGSFLKEYATPLAYGAQGVGSVLESRAQERIAERRLSMEEQLIEEERRRRQAVAEMLRPFFERIASDINAES